MKKFSPFTLIFLSYFFSFFFLLTSCSSTEEPDITENIENGDYFEYEGFGLVMKDNYLAVKKLPNKEDVIIPEFFRLNNTDYQVKEILSLLNNLKVTTVHIPKSITKMEGVAFLHIPNLKKLYIEDLNAWCDIDFESNSNGITFNTTVFIEGQDMTDGSLVIPDHIKEIKPYAFSGLNIKTLQLGKNVEIIGHNAFEGCKNLTDIIFNDKLKEIQRFAFYSTKVGEEIVFPDSVEFIGTCAFYFSNLYRVTLPENIKEIGFGAFNYVKVIKIASMESWLNITWSDDDYYNTSQNVEPWTFPFECPHDLIINNKLIKNLVITDDIKELKEYAFAYTNIESVECFNSELKVNNSSFFMSLNIEKVILPGNLIKELLTRITDIHFIKGESVVEFYPLKYLELTEGSKDFKDFSIDKYPLLESITLPSSIEYCELDLNYFPRGYKYDLEKFIVKSKEVPECSINGSESMWNTYMNFLKQINLVVPNGCVEKYKNSEIWKDFGNISEGDF